MPRLRHPYRDKRTGSANNRPTRYAAKISIDGDCDITEIAEYLNSYYDTWKFKLCLNLRRLGLERDSTHLEQVKFVPKDTYIRLYIGSKGNMSEKGLEYLSDICEDSFKEINKDLPRYLNLNVKLKPEYCCLFSKVG